MTEDAALALQQHPFPGNVRELEHLIERVSVQMGGRAITGSVIRDHLGTIRRSGSGPDLHALLDLPFHASVVKWEKLLIDHAMEVSGGNKSDAARRLGIHHRLLYEKLQQIDHSELDRTNH